MMATTAYRPSLPTGQSDPFNFNFFDLFSSGLSSASWAFGDNAITRFLTGIGASSEARQDNDRFNQFEQNRLAGLDAVNRAQYGDINSYLTQSNRNQFSENAARQNFSSTQRKKGQAYLDDLSGAAYGASSQLARGLNRNVRGYDRLANSMVPQYQALSRDLLDSYRMESSAVGQQYADRLNRNLGYLDAAGTRARSDINRTFDDVNAQNKQNLIGSGLYGSSVMSTLNNGAARAKGDAISGLESTLAQQRVATDSALSGDALNQRQASLNYASGLSERRGADTLAAAERLKTKALNARRDNAGMIYDAQRAAYGDVFGARSALENRDFNTLLSFLNDRSSYNRTITDNVFNATAQNRGNERDLFYNMQYQPNPSGPWTNAYGAANARYQYELSKPPEPNWWESLMGPATSAATTAFAGPVAGAFSGAIMGGRKSQYGAPPVLYPNGAGYYG